MQRRDRTPRVELAARWNLPRDVPQASKGPSFPATANPGEAIFECEITNVGIAGVKIREVYVYIDAPPGKPTLFIVPSARGTTEKAGKRGFTDVVGGTL